LGRKILGSGGKGNKKKSNDMHSNFLHSWPVTPEEAVLIQQELAGRIILEDNPLQFKTVAGADACYRGGKVYGAASVFSLPELDLLDQAVACREISFPYIPGFLSFREGPVLLDCLEKLSRTPEVIIFDGHGIAHPRGFGLAAHLGLILGWPSIGCAKEKLVGEFKEPDFSRGSWTPLTDIHGRSMGAVLRTREKVKPVYVSPGFKISLEKAVELVLSSSPKFRIPEPLREAHHLALLEARIPSD